MQKEIKRDREGRAIRVVRRYTDMGYNLHIVEDYFNVFNNECFLDMLKDTSKGEGGGGYEYLVFTTPEDLMEWEDYNPEPNDCIGQSENIEFSFGPDFDDIPDELAHVSFEDMKSYFHEASEVQILLTPEHEEEIRGYLVKIDAIYDNYIEKRAEYLRTGKCPES